MAKLIINTGDWRDQTDGGAAFLSCKVLFGPTAMYAYALRVENRPDDETRAKAAGWPEDEIEEFWYQRAYDPEYEGTYRGIVDLVDSSRLNTVKIPDFDGEYVVWLEP